MENKVDENSVKSNAFIVVLCILSFVVMIGYLVFVDSIKNVVAVLKIAHVGWLIAAVASIFVYWLLDGVALHMSLKPVHPSQKLSVSMRVAMIGQYFNAITPLASGGEPAQAYFLVKNGAPLGQAMSALLTKFIVYQLTLTAISVSAIVFRFNFFMGHVNALMVAVLFGFAGNTVITLGLLAIALFKDGTKKVVHKCIDFLTYIHIVKNPVAKHEYAEVELNNFNKQFTYLSKHKFHLVKIGLVTAVQLLAYFFIGNVIYYSFCLTGADSVTLLAAQSFVHMIASSVPIPGGIGAAEGSFSMFFSMFFPENMIGLAVVLWRLITFYLSIVVGLVFTVIEKRRSSTVPLEETPVVDDLVPFNGEPQFHSISKDVNPPNKDSNHSI